MGIIDAQNYLEEFRWVVNQREDGKYFLTQMPLEFGVSGSMFTPRATLDDMDLVLFAINQGYMPQREEYERHLANISTNRLMTSEATMTPAVTRQTFRTAMAFDPTSVGALILGLDINHEFFSVVADQSVPAIRDDTNYDRVQAYQVACIAKQGRFPVAPVADMGGYQWTGQMNELYKTTEPGIGFSDATNGQSWTTTDVGNPSAFDNFLANNGHSPEFLQPNCKCPQLQV